MSMTRRAPASPALTDVLNRRTAVETAEPMAVDIEHDELVFFPLLYWPVVPGEAQPSPTAVERLNRYLATGGTILFDTRDQGDGTPSARPRRRRCCASSPPGSTSRRWCRCRPTTSSPNRST